MPASFLLVDSLILCYFAPILSVVITSCLFAILVLNRNRLRARSASTSACESDSWSCIIGQAEDCLRSLSTLRSFKATDAFAEQLSEQLIDYVSETTLLEKSMSETIFLCNIIGSACYFAAIFMIVAQPLAFSPGTSGYSELAHFPLSIHIIHVLT